MNLSYRISLAALTTWLALSMPARAAMVIDPASISPMPTITSPSAQGTLIPVGGLVEDQYAGLGIGFGNTAVTRTNGTLTFAPAGSIFPWAPPPTSLNYRSLDGAVEGVFVAPKLSGYATTSYLSIEFLGVQSSGLSGVGAISVFGTHGQVLGNAFTSSGIGPHGGSVVTIHTPGIILFAAYRTLSAADPDATAPWGIAQIEFGPLQSVNRTPEPTGLALFAIGLATLAGTGRRNRRPRIAQSP